ncbi:MAG: glycosyltransferase family 39 protein [Elusimicrobiota bacterium]|jgi:hypothetical protein
MTGVPVDARARAGAWAGLLAILLLAAFLRLDGASFGLPAVFNADEPHHVNVAVSFARGSLNPGVFKYPTLWMYVLFAAYGVSFALWSGFGLLRSAADFGGLFVWHPEGFYLLGRLLAAACSLAGLGLVLRSGERLLGRRGGLLAAALLAVSPALVVSAHAAKPDSLMFLLSAAAWLCAVRHYDDGGEAPLMLCGVFAGLAASTQYTAAPLAALVPAAAFARALDGGSPRPAREANALRAAVTLSAKALGCWFLGFLGGSPFIALDGRAFLRDVRDQGTVVGAGGPVGWAVLGNAAAFAGPWAVGGPLLAGGALLLLLRERAKALLLLGPCVVLLVPLALSPEGGWQRYQLSVFPAYALAAAFFVERVLAALPARAPLFPLALLALALPGAAQCRAFDRELVLPDTRSLAADWLERERPGAAVLTDQEHASPPLRMSREQVAELLERTRAEGHPRARYYELMLRSHPGGGRRVLRILRSGADLRSGTWHAGWSARGRAVLDVREGLSAARAAGVEVVALSSSGADPARSPELAAFFAALEQEGRPLAVFMPAPGERRGPVIRILDIRRRKR